MPMTKLWVQTLFGDASSLLNTNPMVLKLSGIISKLSGLQTFANVESVLAKVGASRV